MIRRLDSLGRRCSRPSSREGGFALPSLLVGTAASFIFLMTTFSFLINLYGTGIVRHALDSGARAWALEEGTQADCQAKSRQVLTDLLGNMGSRVSVRCTDTGDTITAESNGILPGVVDALGVTDVDSKSKATVMKEPRLLDELNPNG